MSHRKGRSKLVPTSPILRSQRCRFCQTSFKMGLRQLQYIQLNKKYLLTDIEAGYCCKFESFINGGFKVFPGGINQYSKLYTSIVPKYQYHNLSEIKEKITQTILSHAFDAQNRPMHFQEKYFEILMKNYQKNKDLKKKKCKYIKSSKDHCKQSTQVGDAVLRTAKTPNVQILKKLKTTNQSMIQLKKLTKTVSKMFHKFPNKGLLADFNRQFDRKGIKSKEKEKYKIQNLEKKITQKISVIKQNKQKQTKTELKVQEDRYELKKQKYQKKGHKRTSSEIINEKKTYDARQPLTPAYQFIPPNQYFCGDKIKKVKEIKSKSKKKILKKRSESQTKSEQKPKKRIVICTYHQ